MRAFIVDTAATIVFFTIVATFSELVIAGMTPGQVAVTRALMVPIMVLTGRPYGLWRDWVFGCVQPRGRLRVALLDVVVFLMFQIPVYGATLLSAGADGAEVVAALGSATVFMLVLSRPFGVFLDHVRRWARA